MRLKAILLLVSFLTAVPAWADCNCNKTAEEQALSRMRELAAKNLPSEADRQIAQQFTANGLEADALPYYAKALEKADGEVVEAERKKAAGDPKSGPAHVAGVKEHAALIARDYARLLRKQGKFGESAALLDKAVDYELQANSLNLNLEREYSQIAGFYILTEDFRRAADTYKKLVEVQSKKHGRYSEHVLYAKSLYENALKRSSVAMSAGNIPK